MDGNLSKREREGGGGGLYFKTTRKRERLNTLGREVLDHSSD